MKLKEFAFLTDENIPFRVVEWLINEGFDIIDIKISNLSSISDEEVMNIAEKQQRIIITQDSDLATILFKNNITTTGVLYLRPGHVNSKTIITTLQYIFDSNIEVEIPFIVVADNQGDKILLRVRLL